MSKSMELFAKDLITEEVDITEHLVQFEAKDHVNELSEDFFFQGRLK